MSFFRGFARGLNESLDRAQKEEQRRQSQELINLQAKQIKRQLEQEQLVKDQTAEFLKLIQPSVSTRGQADLTGRTEGISPDNPLLAMPQMTPGLDAFQALALAPEADRSIVTLLTDLQEKDRTRRILESMVSGGPGGSGATGQRIETSVNPATGSITYNFKPREYMAIDAAIPGGGEQRIFVDKNNPSNVFNQGPVQMNGQAAVPSGSVAQDNQVQAPTTQATIPGAVVTKLGKRDLPAENVENFRGADGQIVPPQDRGKSVAELNSLGFANTTKEQREALDQNQRILQQLDDLFPLYQAVFGQRPNTLPEDLSQLPPVLDANFFENAQNIFSNYFSKADNEKRYKSLQDVEQNSSWFKGLKNRINTLTGENEALRLYFDRVLPLAVQLARAGGEVGTMTEGDISRAIAKLPFVGLSVNQFGNINLLDLRRADSYRVGIRKFYDAIKEVRQTPTVKNFRDALGGQPPPPTAIDAVYARVFGNPSGMNVNSAVGQRNNNIDTNQLSEQEKARLIQLIRQLRTNGR